MFQLLINIFQTAILGVFVLNLRCAVFGDIAHIPLTNATPDLIPASPRIIGGWKAKPGEFPYQVSIRYRYVEESRGPGKGHFCGGSLVAMNLVILAAHCLYDNTGTLDTPNMITVVAGDLYLYNNRSDTTTRGVVKIIPHKEFVPGNWTNDIALLVLDKPFSGNNAGIGTIMLQNQTMPVDTNCTASGWGYTAPIVNGTTSVVSADLMGVDLLVTDFQDCLNIYQDLGGIPDTGLMCAGTKDGGKDTCNGDSGGPIVCDGLLTGIVASGYECALAGIPGFNVDVKQFVDWFEENKNIKSPSGGSIPTSVSVVMMAMAMGLHYLTKHCFIV